jgi:hypothetical protein
MIKFVSDLHQVGGAGHHFRVFAAIYHPEISHVFLTGGWDNTVHVGTSSFNLYIVQ